MTATGIAHPRAQELQRFVEQDYRQVIGSVTLITGDRASAEDAVQDALVKAWRRRDQPIERLAAWITVVASNEARGRRRRSGSERRAVERFARTSAPPPTDGIPELPDPELQAALAALPLRERQAAVLFYVSDLSVVDVAAALGVTDGTVKTMLSRARAHLAASLETGAAGGVA